MTARPWHPAAELDRCARTRRPRVRDHPRHGNRQRSRQAGGPRHRPSVPAPGRRQAARRIRRLGAALARPMDHRGVRRDDRRGPRRRRRPCGLACRARGNRGQSTISWVYVRDDGWCGNGYSMTWLGAHPSLAGAGVLTAKRMTGSITRGCNARVGRCARPSSSGPCPPRLRPLLRPLRLAGLRAVARVHGGWASHLVGAASFGHCSPSA
jgi:hypothetical protein